MFYRQHITKHIRLTESIMLIKKQKKNKIANSAAFFEKRHFPEDLKSHCRV